MTAFHSCCEYSSFLEQLRYDFLFLSLSSLGICKMRTVNFVDPLELEFSGNISIRAVALGDADNDGLNELVVGNILGDLAVFKGSDHKAFAKYSGLGMITCVDVGQVCNNGKNLVVCLSSDGWIFLFELHAQHEGSKPVLGSGELVLKHRQHLRANTKVMLLADTDDDGKLEVVIGFSDRLVFGYRWSPQADPPAFVLAYHWQLLEQIGALTSHTGADGRPLLLASQPGRTCVSLQREDEEEGPGPGKVLPNCGDLLGVRARNKNSSTEIVGDVQCAADARGVATKYFALASLDGTVVLLDGEHILWSLHVDHQLQGLSKLDVTGDGTQEVIVCSWGGQTYIVNPKRQVTRFQFQDNVAAFCAGSFSADGRRNSPCLVYATFQDRVCVYHDISLPRLSTLSLRHQLQHDTEVTAMLHRLRITDEATQKKLFHWLLNGQHKLDDVIVKTKRSKAVAAEDDAPPPGDGAGAAAAL